MDHSAWREHIGTLIAILSSSDAGDLPTILFDGRSDWYAADADELIESLSRRLSGEQADRLLALVRTGDSGDQRSAIDELRRWVAPPLEFEELVGYENPHWAANPVPGTNYYTYHDEEYLYLEWERAPRAHWRTLDERLAEQARHELEAESAMVDEVTDAVMSGLVIPPEKFAAERARIRAMVVLEATDPGSPAATPEGVNP